jgi:hypothetical protein
MDRDRSSQDGAEWIKMDQDGLRLFLVWVRGSWVFQSLKHHSVMGRVSTEVLTICIGA